MEYHNKDSPPHTKVKVAPTLEKLLMIIFWDSTGIIHIEFLPPRFRIDSEMYQNILQRFRQRLNRIRPGKNILQHDNARPHKSLSTREYIASTPWALLDHPPYSPDLAPCDYYLFGKLKKHLRGEKFETSDELQKAVLSYFNSKDSLYFQKEIYSLPNRWRTCSDSNGEFNVR